MATEPTSTASSAASTTAQAKGPATLVIAGVLALALGGLGVAAVMMGKKSPSMTAQNDEQADKIAADKAAAEAAAKAKAGVASQATLTVKPQEDAPLSDNNSRIASPGTVKAGGESAFPAEDPSLK